VAGGRRRQRVPDDEGVPHDARKGAPRAAAPRKIAAASTAARRRAAAPLTPCPRRAAPQWGKLHFAEREKFEAYKQWQRQKQRDRPLAAAPSGEGGSE
jgi:hypothetical protein